MELHLHPGDWKIEVPRVPGGTSDLSIAQSHGMTEAESCVQLMVYIKELWLSDDSVVCWIVAVVLVHQPISVLLTLSTI